MTTIVTQSVQSGTVTSGIVWIPWGAKTVTLQALMNAADVMTGGNVLNLCVIWSFDAVRTSHAASCVWKSGLVPLIGGGIGNSAPWLKMPIPAGAIGFAGQIVSPRTLNVGLAMDIEDGNGNSLPISAPSGSGVPIQVPTYPSLSV